MLLPRFELHRPESVTEACRIMEEYRDQAKVLAGGTDLLVNLKKKKLKPPNVVALDRLDELKKINTRSEGIVIGARARISDILRDKTLNGRVGPLKQAAAVLGSPLIRNLATVGGNLVTARPASDMAPPLIAMAANVVLKSSRGEREILLENFMTGPGESLIEPDEILTEIKVPSVPAESGGGYEKLGLRKALEIGIVNVAAFIALGPDNKTIETARVVLGAVAPTPIRSPQAEAALVGAEAGAETFNEAARASVGDSCAIDDFRGTMEYRCMVLEVLTRRALEKAWAQINAKRGERS